MVNPTYEEIIQKIIQTTSLPRVDIENKIEKKIVELQDLISREGAAHIIANELNVRIYESIPKKLKISEIIPGMNSIGLTAKVITINPTREFNSKNRTGKVSSLLVADETGSIKLTIWDDNLISKLGNLEENDIIKIQNAYSKENRGFNELHLGNRSQLLINPEGEHIGEVKLKVKSVRKNILDLKENDFVEIMGTIVQVFEPKVYDACPECNKKMFLEDKNYICSVHGKTIPKKVAILNLFVDDSTSNIRTVLFRENADFLIKENLDNFENLKKDILGKQMVFSGKVVKNEGFNRIEFVVNAVQEANPEEILKEIQK